MTKLVKYNIPLFCLKYKSKWRKSDKKQAPSAGMPAALAGKRDTTVGPYLLDIISKVWGLSLPE